MMLHGVFTRARTICLVLGAAGVLQACGGGGGGGSPAAPGSYTIGGAVSGLIGSVVLQNNGGDNLTVNSSGNFTFTGKVNNNGAYAVTVLTQPTGQTCLVSAGAGTVSGNNVTNVAVTCATNAYTVGGTVSGLTGSVVLQNNSGDNLTVSASGAFTFATPVTHGGPYAITVLTQPSGQTCSVSTGAGTVSGNNVTNVAVTCATNAYTVGGTVSGLTGSVVLQNNSGDSLTVSASGAFAFATPVAHGGPYSVTVLTQPVGQSCSIANGTGTIAANVSNVAITCATHTHTVGGAVSGLNGSMVLQNNGGDNLTVTTNGPFTFPSAVSYGNPYSVTRLSLQYPNQACTISNGSGVVSANVSDVGVACAKFTAPRYAYTANYNNNSVSTYVVDAASGLLKYIGKVAAGAAPYAVTVHPTGKYAYVANNGGNTVSQYSIGTNGALTAMATPAVATGLWPNSVTVDPTGKYAYVANDGDATVSQYSIGANGELAAMATPKVAAGVGPFSVTVDPNGKYAYVANNGDNTVLQFSIGANGELAAMSPSKVAAGAIPLAVTVDPNGKYAYVANNGDGTISQYRIGANGALTAMAAPTVAAGASPNSVTVDPTGKYAYVTHLSGTVSQYSIGADGALTAMATPTVAAGTNPMSVTVDPSGKYAYVADYSGDTVSQYSIGATGALTPLSTATVAAMDGPYSIVMSAGAASARAVAKYAYVANHGDNTISQYSIGAGGALTAMATPTVAAGGSPYSVTVDPSGKYAYVANWGGNNISQYTIGTGGALTAMTTATVAAGLRPQSVTIDPSGRFAYVANGGDNTVSQYSIGADGALTVMTTATVAAGVGPSSVTVHPSGNYVYVANTFGSSVSQYIIGFGGFLTAMTTPSVAAGTRPQSVTIDPTGRYAYVANGGNTSSAPGTILQYTVGADGTLTAMATPAVAAGALPVSVTVDPSGRYAYVANNTDATISQYSIGADGALTAMATPSVSSVGPMPTSVTVDPTGKYAYVTANSQAISQYSIGPDGALTAMAAPMAAVGAFPESIITVGTWQ